MNLFQQIFLKKKPRLSVSDGIFFENIKEMIGFKPKKLLHYRTAFTHRSLNKIDEKGNQISYERLEFLGDSILSATIAIYLFKKVPSGNEGYLTKMRSKIVNRQNLNEIGKSLDLLKFMNTKVDKKNFGNNVFGNILEALLGAIFLDLGYHYCENFINKKIINLFDDIVKLEKKVISYKSLMIEWCQKEKRIIEFETFSDNHLSTDKFFAVHLKIDGKIAAKAREISKKKAEEKASHRAFFAFKNKIENKK